MTWEEWLAVGRDRGWIGKGFCAQHDMPVTDATRDRIAAGYDPCQPALVVLKEQP